jgi:hypothetical protein
MNIESLRHPGEGRDPATVFVEIPTALPKSKNSWIPAYTGMTSAKSAGCKSDGWPES